MKKYIFLCIAPIMMYAAVPKACSGCAAGKSMAKCDYYVQRKGDTSKQYLCENYAKFIDTDGTHATASWYYLLGGDPKKALQKADIAIKQGQIYAAEYAALALAILGNKVKAKEYIHKFKATVLQREYFLDHLKILKKLYPSTDFSFLN